jgi:predicted O-methyltransferase YrrM
MRMSGEEWVPIDERLAGLFAADREPERALQASRAAGLPDISVTAAQGKLLNILARAQRARSILEIGTLGGYSTIWLAKALADGGRLITLEANAKHAEAARLNIARAGLADKVDVRVGPALGTLAQLEGPFDMIFIDADKPSYPDYLTWSLKLSRPGTLIVADNVVLHGDVFKEPSDDPRVHGMRRFLEQLASEPRVTATVTQTVGSKGHDGLAIALVTGEA